MHAAQTCPRSSAFVVKVLADNHDKDLIDSKDSCISPHFIGFNKVQTCTYIKEDKHMHK